MFLHKKVDSIKLEKAERKGFESGKEKMREVKNKEIKTLKNRFWKIVNEKNDIIKERDKRIKEIEKYLSNLKTIIISFKNYSSEVSAETEDIRLKIAREQSYANRKLSEIESIDRNFHKEYSRIMGLIEDYKIEAKLN